MADEATNVLRQALAATQSADTTQRKQGDPHVATNTTGCCCCCCFVLVRDCPLELRRLPVFPPPIHIKPSNQHPARTIPADQLLRSIDIIVLQLLPRAIYLPPVQFSCAMLGSQHNRRTHRNLERTKMVRVGRCAYVYRTWYT